MKKAKIFLSCFLFVLVALFNSISVDASSVYDDECPYKVYFSFYSTVDTEGVHSVCASSYSISGDTVKFSNVYRLIHSSENGALLKKIYYANWDWTKNDLKDINDLIKYVQKDFKTEVKDKMGLSLKSVTLPTVVGVSPMKEVLAVVVEILPTVVSLIVSYLALKKAFQWLLLQLRGC